MDFRIIVSYAGFRRVDLRLRTGKTLHQNAGGFGIDHHFIRGRGYRCLLWNYFCWLSRCPEFAVKSFHLKTTFTLNLHSTSRTNCSSAPPRVASSATRRARRKSGALADSRRKFFSNAPARNTARRPFAFLPTRAFTGSRKVNLKTRAAPASQLSTPNSQPTTPAAPPTVQTSARLAAMPNPATRSA